LYGLKSSQVKWSDVDVDVEAQADRERQREGEKLRCLKGEKGYDRLHHTVQREGREREREGRALQVELTYRKDFHGSL
jgi:hypothetical protein